MADEKYDINEFSEKALQTLGDYYVYGLADPRNNRIFYIGKGTGNRVFHHELESMTNPESEKLKLKTISEIKENGLEVIKIIINSNLTEDEAFAAEASLINILNYITDNDLTNIVAGHHTNGAMTVEEFEKLYGAEELLEEDINHKLMVIKINKLYKRSMNERELYDTVRGIWKASITRASEVDYVFGVFNSLVVGVYKPSNWYICKNKPELLPQGILLDNKNENRIFFVDRDFENGLKPDEAETFYIGKSIKQLKINQSAQNPITYLEPI